MLKATGIVRNIDNLGRYCIPREIRRTLGIAEGDPLEVHTNNYGEIILSKYEPKCIFCNEISDQEFKGKKICSKCSRDIKNF